MEIPIEIYDYLAEEQYQLLSEDPDIRPMVEQNSLILDAR